MDPVTGALFISDTNSRRIYRVRSLTGGRLLSDNAEVVAGTGEQCLPFDERCGDGGKATEATLMSPKGEEAIFRLILETRNHGSQAQMPKRKCFVWGNKNPLFYFPLFKKSFFCKVHSSRNSSKAADRQKDVINQVNDNLINGPLLADQWILEHCDTKLSRMSYCHIFCQWHTCVVFQTCV